SHGHAHRGARQLRRRLHDDARRPGRIDHGPRRRHLPARVQPGPRRRGVRHGSGPDGARARPRPAVAAHHEGAAMSGVRSSRSELWLGRIVLAMLVVFTLLPFIGMLSAALQPAGSNPVGIQIPTNPQWGNFITAFEMSKLPTLMTSSLILVLMVVPAGLALATAAAYGIVVLRVPYGGVAFLVLLLGLTIPFESLIVPLYHLMKDAGLLNTRLAIAMPLIALYLPFGVFWMRAHFMGVPKELTEAAEMDGAGWWKALRLI